MAVDEETEERQRERKTKAKETQRRQMARMVLKMKALACMLSVLSSSGKLPPFLFQS